MTSYTSYQNLPVPDQGQLKWADEVQEAFEIIDTALKNINENSIDKKSATFDGVNIDSSISLDDGVSIALGTDNDLTATYNATENKTYIKDTSSGDTLIELPHGSGDIKFGRNITDSASGSSYATESYADSSTDSADITPSSVTTDSVTTDWFNSIRMLSSFSSLQAAVDWSDANLGTVFVDGTYETDEGTVTLNNRCVLVGSGYLHSEIVTTNTSTTGPIFQYNRDDGKNTTTQFQNFTVNNNGNTSRGFFKPEDPSTYDGFIGTQTHWKNLKIDGVGGTYPVDWHNAYAAYISNVYVHTKNSDPNGHFRFKNCNACTFRGLRGVYCASVDNETPVMYFLNCVATHVDAPHIEHLSTDAAIQVSGGGIVITSPHIEGNLNTFHSDYNAGIQVGDGGIATGNTAGTTSQTPLTVIGGVTHGSANPLEAVRILNGDEVTLITHKGGNADNSLTYVNYGGSNHDASGDITTTPGNLTVFGNNNQSNEIVNNSGGDYPEILVISGKTFFDEGNARDALGKYEIGFMNNNTGTHSLVKRDDDGTAHVWDPERTL